MGLRLYGIAAAIIIAAAGSACEPDARTSAAAAIDVSADENAWRIDRRADIETFLDCLEENGLSIVSAHRGGPGRGRPENSLEAISATLAAAPALIEFDVATSADGVLFLMHDDTLDRTTTGAGAYADKTWADIEKIRLVDADGQTGPSAPPTFADALKLVTERTFAQIDFKRSTRYEDVIAEVRRQGAEGRVILIAYSTAQARRLNQLAPEMKISASMENPSRLDEILAAGLETDSVVAFAGIDDVDPSLNATLDARDVEVIFGTLGGPRSIDNAIARTGDDDRYAEISRAGVDVIATDRPVAAHRALVKAGRAPQAGVCGLVAP